MNEKDIVWSQITNNEDGIFFAEFLHMSFGPQARKKSEFIEKSLKPYTENAVNLYMEIMTLTNFFPAHFNTHTNLY